MNELFKNQAFKSGFYGTIFLFILITYVRYRISYNAFLDYLEGKGEGPHFSVASYSVGFPFEFCHFVTANPSGIYTDQFSLAVNVLIIFTSSLLIGLVFKRIFSQSNDEQIEDSVVSLLNQDER